MESINLIDLFAAEPEMADRWVAGEFRKFTPSKVRKRLGLKEDPIYAWASEHSHPRFAGFQLTTYKKVHRETGHETIQPFIGGLPLEFPIVLMATTMPANTLSLLAFALQHVTVKKEVAAAWGAVVRRVGETLLPGYEAVYQVLHERHGMTEEEGAKILDGIRTTINSAAEIESLVAEAGAEQQEPT